MFVSRLVRRPQTLLLAAAIGVAALGLGAQHTPSAHAYEEWCFDDPVVQVGNNMVQTTIGIAGAPAYVRAHVHEATITYHLPSNVPAAKVIATDAPYFAEKVVFFSTGVPVLPGQPIPVLVTLSFQTDLVGQLLVSQVNNTTQPAAAGAQTAPSQGKPFTTSSYGLTLLNLTAGGFTWHGTLSPNPAPAAPSLLSSLPLLPLL